MMEPISNGSNYDMFTKAKPVGMPDVQTERQAVTEKPEVQTNKKSADTVTISQEAVNAQANAAVKSAPEQARENAMQESQDMATRGTNKNNPLEALVQSYGGVSK